MSDTPRTDNEAWSEGSSVPELVTAELARQLERELTAAKGGERWALAERVVAELEKLDADKAYEYGRNAFLAEINALKKEADARDAELALLRKRVEAADGLATELEEFAHVGREYYNMDMGPNGSRMLDASEKALAAYRATEGKK